MGWQWDWPTLIALGGLGFTGFGYGARLCIMLKARARDDAITHDRLAHLERELNLKPWRHGSE